MISACAASWALLSESESSGQMTPTRSGDQDDTRSINVRKATFSLFRNDRPPGFLALDFWGMIYTVSVKVSRSVSA